MDMNRCLLQGLNIIERMFPVIQVVFGSVMTKRGVKLPLSNQVQYMILREPVSILYLQPV